MYWLTFYRSWEIVPALNSKWSNAYHCCRCEKTGKRTCLMFHGRGYSLTLVFFSLRVAVSSPYVTPWGEGALTHKRRVAFSKMNNEQEKLKLSEAKLTYSDAHKDPIWLVLKCREVIFQTVKVKWQRHSAGQGYPQLYVQHIELQNSVVSLLNEGLEKWFISFLCENEWSLITAAD